MAYPTAICSYEEYRKKYRAEQMRQLFSETAHFFYDAPEKYGFEERQGQTEMALEIVAAINNNEHLAVEAGVGIGKSFAYLVPLLLYNTLFEEPVVVATSTIALQEQLLGDVERLKTLLELDTEVCLVKGQSHYLCKKRAEKQFKKHQFELESAICRDMKAGVFDRRSFPYQIPNALWDKINVASYCRRTCEACEHYDRCGYVELRNDLPEFDGLVLCNQDQLAAHLKNESEGGNGILPSRLRVIAIDEAHNLESKVRNAVSVVLNQRAIIGLLKDIRKDTKDMDIGRAEAQMANVTRYTQKFFGEISRQVKRQIEEAGGANASSEIFYFENSEKASSHLKALSDYLYLLSLETFKLQLQNRDLKKYHRKVQELYSMTYGASGGFDQQVVWLQRNGKEIELAYCTKDIKRVFQTLFFKRGVTTIMASATLTNSATGDVDDQYAYFVNNTGFAGYADGTLSVPKPSPFPYDEHAMVYYSSDLPHPTHEHDLFMKKGIERVVDLLRISNGRALILFTAKTDMDEVYLKLKAMNLPFKILKQQASSSQDKILKEFRENENSVLLGTGAYWEGISIEGKSLSHVIIFRLPFPTPDPIIDYKAAEAEDSLMDVLVPEMVIKLKQGIGRLIRNYTDKGIVSIIDSRLRDERRTRYHDIAWDALPIKNRTDDIVVIRNFYNNLHIDE